MIALGRRKIMEMQIGKVTIEELHNIDPYLNPDKLRVLLKANLVSGWALQQLKILADMVDPDQAHITGKPADHRWIKKELDRIIEGTESAIYFED